MLLRVTSLSLQLWKYAVQKNSRKTLVAPRSSFFGAFYRQKSPFEVRFSTKCSTWGTTLPGLTRPTCLTSQLYPLSSLREHDYGFTSDFLNHSHYTIYLKISVTSATEGTQHNIYITTIPRDRIYSTVHTYTYWTQ